MTFFYSKCRKVWQNKTHTFFSEILVTHAVKKKANMCFSKMELYEYTRSIGRRFCNRREWFSFALAMERKGLVKSYRKTLRSGEKVDGFRIIELAALKKELTQSS